MLQCTRPFRWPRIRKTQAETQQNSVNESRSDFHWLRHSIRMEQLGSTPRPWSALDSANVDLWIGHRDTVASFSRQVNSNRASSRMWYRRGNQKKKNYIALSDLFTADDWTPTEQIGIPWIERMSRIWISISEILPLSSEFYWVLLDLTGFDWVWLGFVGYYWFLRF